MQTDASSQLPASHRARKRRLLTFLVSAATLLATLPAHAQATGSDPWDNAVNVLKTAFTGTIATGLSLVAIVVGGLMFAYGEGQSKKMLAGLAFRNRWAGPYLYIAGARGNVGAPRRHF
jgi:type IV secretory pathway VirB2 component (pilin)